MNILVIGGMHGNEPLGLEVVELFRQNKVDNVDTLLANEQAIRQKVRFTGTDLNRSFPGSLTSDNYEQKRAAQIIEIAKKYDIVIDFHNTNCPNNDCSFVGDNARQNLYNVSSWLGLNKVIVADYDCLNKYAPNCISIEVSLDSQFNDAEYWFQKIVKLSKLDLVNKKQDVQTYSFVYRMTLEDRDRLKLPKEDMKAFEPIDTELARVMGVESPAYPIFINDAYTPYNYGGLLNKIDV